MSTVADPRNQATTPEVADPFRYGWRDLTRQRPDGSWYVERTPLTLEDVLHPQMGDVLVESYLHDLIRDYLADVFRAWLAGVPGALVLTDCGVYWGHPELRHHSPDVCVILGVREMREEWASFDVADQGVRPVLIIEIVSPHTRENDVATKLEQYHRARVPRYVIVDREQEGGPVRLLGYEYTPTGYLAMPADAQGRLWLEAVGVWISARGNRVVCYDGATGAEIGDYTAVSRALAEEKTRAEAAELRLRELEAEIRRLRGEPPASGEGQ
jgi:Uma2 family endonuclease